MTTRGGQAGELLILGRVIAKARVDANLTQVALARDVGRGEITVSQWETGIRSPSILDLMRIALACGITLSRLMMGLDDFRPPHVEQKRPKPAQATKKTRKPRRKNDDTSR